MFMFLFLPVFSMLLPRENFTMLRFIFRLKELFQVKNGVTTFFFFFFFFENGKNLGRSDDGKWRKRRGWPYGKNVLRLYRETLIISKF